MIVDPKAKPLTSRISANKVDQAKVVAKKNALKKKQGNNKPNQPKKENKKPVKKAKKTVEELDQEMTDYFETS